MFEEFKSVTSSRLDPDKYNTDDKTREYINLEIRDQAD